MPSLPHELLVELFRANAALAPALVRAAGIPVAAARAEAGSIDLSQVAPTEYRADAVVVCGDDAGRAVLGVIVEVQARVDRRKEATWPVYAATLRAKLGCPVVVLVVALDAGVAEWARAPLALGPGSYLTPVVVGAAEVPRPADAGEARRVPELAVLAALAHRDEATAALALGAISELPEDVARLYWDAVLAELPAQLRQIRPQRPLSRNRLRQKAEIQAASSKRPGFRWGNRAAACRSAICQGQNLAPARKPMVRGLIGTM